MKQQLTRPQYCPIGTLNKIRMLPSSFCKICNMHREKAKDVSESIASLMLRVCKTCPVGKEIEKGESPETFVTDVEWIEANEVQAILNRRAGQTVIADTLEKAAKKTKKLASVIIKEQIQELDMDKNTLLKMKELAHSLTSVISELSGVIDKELSKADTNDVVTEEVKSPVIPIIVETVQTDDVPVKKEKPEWKALGKKEKRALVAQYLEAHNMNKKLASEYFGISIKHISTLYRERNKY